MTRQIGVVGLTKEGKLHMEERRGGTKFCQDSMAYLHILGGNESRSAAPVSRSPTLTFNCFEGGAGKRRGEKSQRERVCVT